MDHIKVYGDEAGNLPDDEGSGGGGDGRGRLAPLFWSRAAAHIMIGKFRSAVKDCALALESAGDWEQVGERLSVPLLLLSLARGSFGDMVGFRGFASVFFCFFYPVRCLLSFCGCECAPVGAREVVAITLIYSFFRRWWRLVFTGVACKCLQGCCIGVLLCGAVLPSEREREREKMRVSVA